MFDYGYNTQFLIAAITKISEHRQMKQVFRLKSLKLAMASLILIQSAHLWSADRQPINVLPYQCPKNPTSENIQVLTPNKSKPKQLGKLTSKADDINRQGSKIILKGKVEITNEVVSIIASDATIDTEKETAVIEGGLRFTSEQVEIGSEYLAIDLSNNALTAKDANYRLGEQSLRGKTSKLEINANGKMSMDKASFTSCPADNEVWSIKAGNITIDPEQGRGEATNMTLRIQDIPIFYLPYIQFPASSKRLSGLLLPTFGSSTRNGQEISLPIYWNIANNYDATFTPKYLSDRGTQFISEFRYLTEMNSGKIEAEYLGSDSKATGETPSDRYRLRLQHRSQLTPNWQANVDFEEISDDSYFFDFGGDLTSSRIIEITRQADIKYQQENWGVSLLISDDKTLNTINDPYQRLPQLSWNSHFPIAGSPAEIDFNGEFTAFDRTNSITANRIVLEPRFSYPIEGENGYIHPTIKLNYRGYSQKDPLGMVTVDETFSTPIFSIDAGSYLERNVDYGDETYLQTLEPRIYYLNVPARNQQQIQLYDSTLATTSYQRLFSDNRYSGFDRLGDANQLSVGVSSRILEKNGNEIMRFGIGQAFYFKDRKVTLQSTAGNPINFIEDLTRSSSPLLADLVFNFSDKWRLNSTFEWQPDSKRTESSSFRFQYQPNELDVANIGHRRRLLNSGESLEQVDVSFSWGVHDNWRLIGRWNEDISNNRNIETLFGAEYDSCCWALRIVNRRRLNIPLDAFGFPIPGLEGNYDSGLSIQFVLKGLSSLGSTSFLNSSIEGFRDPYQK